MKKYFFLLLCCGIFSSTFAQFNLSIDYDEAGNRINRKVIVLSSANSNGTNIRLAGTYETPSYSDELVDIYPNPTRYYVNLEFSEMEDSEHIHFQLFDEQGRFVKEAEVKNKLTKVDLSKEPNGVYFLNINRNGKKSEWRIVKIG